MIRDDITDADVRMVLAVIGVRYPDSGATANLVREALQDGVWPIDEYRAIAALAEQEARALESLTFTCFRLANVARCLRWHPAGLGSWSPSDWCTAVMGELGELASLLKMRNRERDGLVGNKFSPSDQQIADELADVVTYLDLLAAALGVDLGRAVVEKFNAVSARNGFPDRLPVSALVSAGGGNG